MNGEKKFANHVSGKGLVSRLYKEILQLNLKKQELSKQLKEEGNQRNGDHVEVYQWGGGRG